MYSNNKWISSLRLYVLYSGYPCNQNSLQLKKKIFIRRYRRHILKNTCFEVVQANRVSVLRVVVSAVTSKTFQERTFRSPISCEPQWIIIWRIPGHTCCRVCRGRCGCCGWCCTFCCVKKIQVFNRLWNTSNRVIYLLNLA